MHLRDRIDLAVSAFRVVSANKRLRLVQLARLASVTGRWAYTITLAVFAYRSGGTGGVALAGIVRLAPAAVAAPFAGSLIHRGRVDTLLLRCGLARTAALALAGVVAIADGSATFVYALVAIESAVSTLIRPVQNSLLPELARTPQELTSTNLVLSVIESAGVLLGPLCGAALLHGTSVGIVFLVSAGLYLASTLLLLPIRTDHAMSWPESRTPGFGFLAEAAAGARAVGTDPDTRIVVFLYGAQNLVAGALNVLIVVTALRLLGLGQSGVGTLTAAVGLGGIVGGAVVFARLRAANHGSDLGVGLLLWGVPLVLLGAISSDAAAFVLLGLVGVGVTVVDVAAVTLLQRTASGELLPHALALLQTVFVASVATGTLLAPVLVAGVGVRGALLVTGTLLPVLAIALWRRLRQLDRDAEPDAELVTLLAAVPIFAPLGDAALDHLASSLRPIALPAHSTVFEQGDHGEGFYVIESGSLEVRVDGELVHTLTAGGYFGEIALLRDVPRTATIVTSSDARLQWLERASFISTVTGNQASSEAADAVVGARLGLSAGLTI